MPEIQSCALIVEKEPMATKRWLNQCRKELKMKLWVDDIRPAPDGTWKIARTTKSAIKAISSYHFDEISLDHDISHQVIMGQLSRPYPCGDCFCGVAYFIAEKYGCSNSKFSQPKIILHSANPIGAGEMWEIFDDKGLLTETNPQGIANRLEQEV